MGCPRGGDGLTNAVWERKRVCWWEEGGGGCATSGGEADDHFFGSRCIRPPFRNEQYIAFCHNASVLYRYCHLDAAIFLPCVSLSYG